MDKLTKEQRLEVLFSKLDLSGIQYWSNQDRNNVTSLIEEYYHLFALGDLELGKTDMVKHSIKLSDYTPFKERYDRILPHQYDEVRKHLQKCLKLEPFGDHAALGPAWLYSKGWHPKLCKDVRRLNAKTVRDAYSLPLIEESLDCLNGTCFFKSLILKSGHWQVMLDKDSIPLTTFTVGPLGVL